MSQTASCDTKRCSIAAMPGSSSFQNHPQRCWRRKSSSWVAGCSSQPGLRVNPVLQNSLCPGRAPQPEDMGLHPQTMLDPSRGWRSHQHLPGLCPQRNVPCSPWDGPAHPPVPLVSCLGLLLMPCTLQAAQILLPPGLGVSAQLVPEPPKHSQKG